MTPLNTQRDRSRDGALGGRVQILTQ